MDMHLGNFIAKNSSLLPDVLIERARALSTPLLSDVMGRFGAMHYTIKPLLPGVTLAGTALTVNIRPADNLFLHKALQCSGKGYVLVVDGKGHMSNAPWGEIMTTIALEKGTEGLILDGVVRDVAAVRRLQFPVFCKGAVPTGGDKDGPGEVNGPISCGGVTVNPGDLVVGDDDGVVIVPRDSVKKIIELAEAKGFMEQNRIKEIRDGRL